ncbi:MAG: di-trans,poly-cis-decaprenylcistransferase [Candidatus Puniceispirillum sp.]|nr:di-trans,poly-cis-decaprenylcistransferase [Candidatus Puniceispirillum sp.]
MPRHVAIIMDGNGRWAQKRGWERMRGHQKGVDAVRRTVQGCMDYGVRYLTLYAFSTENWKRSTAEVSGLMLLLKTTLKAELENFHKNSIRLKVIGRRDRLPQDLVALIEEAEIKTKNNTALTLVVALDYGGRDEIVRAVAKLAQDALAGRIGCQDISEASIARYLDTEEVPDPDLVIRTSDVVRVSNFLLWQAAYSEFLFLDVCWPDFSKEHFSQALLSYQGRERRFGHDKAQDVPHG